MTSERVGNHFLGPNFSSLSKANVPLLSLELRHIFFSHVSVRKYVSSGVHALLDQGRVGEGGGEGKDFELVQESGRKSHVRTRRGRGGRLAGSVVYYYYLTRKVSLIIILSSVPRRIAKQGSTALLSCMHCG